MTILPVRLSLNLLILSLFLCQSIAQEEIEDLGVITPKQGIILEHDGNHTSFHVSVIGASGGEVSFVSTNGIVTMADFKGKISGPAMMTVVQGGGEPVVSTFRITVQRPRPTLKAKVVFTLSPLPLPGGTNRSYAERNLNRGMAPLPPLP